MKSYVIRISILAALLMAATFVAVQPLRSQEKKSGGRDEWNWINSDNGRRIEVKVENKVQFNEDYSDVTSISEDGALRIYDSRESKKYRLIITQVGGELRRDYSVDGQSHSFDAEGRDWLRKVLLQAVREGGLDARNRVQRILKQRGVRGLIDEIAFVKGDYVRRIYFEALLQAPGVTTPELRAALQNASNTIKGDYERAQLLLQVAGVFLNNRELLTDYVIAASKIESDYEKSRVLKAALARADLNKEALTIVAQAAAGLGSDYEKASLLIKAAGRFQSDPDLRAAWLKAVRTIGSDYEHHRTLKGALKTSDLSTEALSSLVESAARMQSDYEKASFLIEAMALYREDPRLRTAFMDTAKTIDSEYERGRVQKRFDQAAF